KGKILLIKQGHERAVNIGDFFVKGDLSANPYVTQGGVVQVPFLDPAGPTVQVRRGGVTFTVQLAENETALDMLSKSYSFAPPEPYAALMVRDGERDTILSPAEAAEYRPAAGARIEVVPA